MFFYYEIGINATWYKKNCILRQGELDPIQFRTKNVFLLQYGPTQQKSKKILYFSHKNEKNNTREKLSYWCVFSGIIFRVIFLPPFVSDPGSVFLVY